MGVGRRAWWRQVSPPHQVVWMDPAEAEQQTPELRERSRTWWAWCHVAGKILIGAKENKPAWTELGGQPSHIAHLFGAHPLPAQPTASCLLSSVHPLRDLTPLVPYHGDIAPWSAGTTSLVPPLCWQGSSSSACYPWILDFYFRPVHQVTHLFSWKPFLKDLRSRSPPSLSCHSFIELSEHLHCLEIHRNNI